MTLCLAVCLLSLTLQTLLSRKPAGGSRAKEDSLCFLQKPFDSCPFLTELTLTGDQLSTLANNSGKAVSHPEKHGGCSGRIG
jgi:hypothetical protein